jgi:hypothetical protein
MSVDFSIVLVGKSNAFADIESNINRQMATLGYRASPDLIPVRFDESRGVFDEMEADESDEGGKRCGSAREYDIDGCTLYVLVAWRNGVVYGFIDVSGRTFNRLIAEDELKQLMAGVGALAQAIQAIAGFGSFDLPFEPIDPGAVIDCIEKVPAGHGEPAVLGIVSFDLTEFADLHRRFANTYDFVPWTTGYWLLKHRDLRH